MEAKEAIDLLHSRLDLIKKYYPDIEDYAEALLMAIEALSAQPEKRTEKRTETHACDLIDRRKAIEEIIAQEAIYSDDAVEILKRLPSAQPEIIRCGQCKYAEVADKEDAQDGYTCQFHRGSVWFSGSYCSWAERRTDG